MNVKSQTQRAVLFIALSLLMVSMGCTVEKVTKDKNNDSDSNSDIDSDTDSQLSNSDARGPSGISLTNAEDTDKVSFPVNNYKDGPELDDTRASLRAIQEADIVQVVGDRLYAISKAGGLAVIDVSVQDSLTLLGRYRSEATPFEMYVRGDRVIVLLKEVPVLDENERPIAEGSRIVTLNVTDPVSIVEENSVDVAGEIIDSRIVDSILFVVSYEEVVASSYYYYEEVDTENIETPTTTVVSFDVSNAADITEVQRLSFDEIQLTWNNRGWSKKSITISDDRLYISGPTDGEHSHIQVVDISDPSGQMTLGTKVEIDGAIFNRWQIDEYENILRVVSQPPDEAHAEPPVVQTFTIVSSQEITPLGSLNIVLPEPELLRSVRFDEDRVYVITFKELDPFFIIDLSDPAVPKQGINELEIPGWIHHMEPRGDRVIGMGFEPGNMDGGLHVSLFDVSDIDNPTQLSRVNFGPTWTSAYNMDEADIGTTFSEDQNRIHKMFKVIDDLGLILVPFSGWGGENAGCGEYASGIQLVTLADDELTKRALIGETGVARRAFVHNERMFTFSEDKMQMFNLDDYDAPVKTAYLPLTLRVHRTAVFGDKVIRIASDWNERIAFADVVPLASVAENNIGLPLSLAGLITTDTESCEYHNDGPFMDAPLFAFGDHLAIPVVHRVPGEEYNATKLIVLNTAGEQLAVAAQLALDFEPINTGLGEGIVQVGNSLVFQRPGDNVNEAGDMQDIVLETVDMTNPAAPVLQPTGLVKPFAAGTTGLHVTDAYVASGYFAYNDEEFVDYFLDLSTFNAGEAPASMEPILFPGLLLGPIASDYLSIDFTWAFEQGQTEEQCVNGGGEYDVLQSVCWYATRVMQRIGVVEGAATQIASAPISNDAQIRALYQGGSRYFLPALNGGHESAQYYQESQYGPMLMVVVGADGAGIATSNLDMGWKNFPQSPVVSNDVLYYLSEEYLVTVTADTVAGATYTERYVSRNTNHLAIAGNQAIVSCGDGGVEVVALQ